MNSRRVLIVDDNVDDIELCTRSLNSVLTCDYQVEYLLEPKELLAKIKESQFDCVIIDFVFPRTSGLTLVKSLRKDFPYIPIVVLTGQTDQEQAAKLIKAGAQDYINKGKITPTLLHDIITDAIVRAETEKEKHTEQDAQCKLLIIDDNPDDIDYCVRMLKRKSKRYHYQSAESGEQGLSILSEFLPDCVLLDHSLPGTTGVDLLPQILDMYPHIPVIMMTGQGNEMIAVEAMKRGAENYLIKSSLDADLLDQNIIAAVEKKQLQHELSIREQALQQKKDEVSALNELQDLMIETLPAYVFVKNKQHQLVKANQAFLSLYPEGEKVLGTTTIEAYNPEEAEAFLAKDKEAFENGYSETTESILFPNGEMHILDTQKTRFYNEKGEMFILGVAKDVTEKMNMIRELQKSNEDLEQFAYIASHDLKSPLNGIKKLVSWIEHDHFDVLPEDAKEHFTLIKTRVDRMNNLLNDLLNYARINTKLTKGEEVNILEISNTVFALNEQSESFSLYAPNISVNLPRVALQIVLMNLINNAMKHSGSSTGNIWIEIDTVSGGYQIAVKDDGPGIPKRYQNKVFQMFQTLKSRDEVEGSGMGLALVKKIMDFYKGAVTIDQEYREGCCIQLFWPSKNNQIKQINT